ncbi:glycosyltransferase family 4 protein [Sphingobacterium wenxiniae]|uniref:Glycosyltransferase involved in cell wall bisynthesis n=1 Tax=Sphingobacterium wenxiniae TaxID=683125 RepID=A0A1I6P2X9_9SPHI|nr:glycosyltransferase family 1 protein [Sphingobacterium wenxiniae]SFS34542.1 Glycosyltransferase involved in cell wall bisynthesis [Sphingobacterium wenxiniae]
MVKTVFFAEILIQEFDGASRTMFQIIDRIDASRFSFLFVCGQGPEELHGHRCLHVPTVNTKVNKDYSLSVPLLVRSRLIRELDAFQPDVIHIATPSLLGFFALKYARQRSIPVISLYHTNFLSYIPYYLKKMPLLIKPVQRWMRAATRRFYNTCQLTYVPSLTMQKQLEDLGVEGERLTLWQRGIDLNLFHPGKRDRDYVQEITGNNQPNILFASRLVWEKNIQTLIDIYHLLDKQGIAHNFLVVGEGPAKEEMQEQMPNAIFLGKLSHNDLAALYASCDVFVFPSVSETYGNVVVEAMASGLPCVIANGGGSADLIRHRQTGYKCKPKAAEDYLIYIRLLLEDDSLRSYIARHALDTVQEMDWNRLTNRYFAELAQLSLKPNRELIWLAG